MPKPYTPPFYYALSTDFDYRSYMEQRSHLDRVVMAIDDQSAALIGSSREIVYSIGQSAELISRQIEASNHQTGEKIDALTAAVEAGFEILSIKLDGVSSQIGDLSQVCELGFDRVGSAIDVSNELLSQIAFATSNRDQAWANEQFNAAKNCVARSLWDDAIQYCTKAIDGDASNPGFKIEPSYHLLRGLIFSGAVGTSINLLDLEQARTDFQNAAKYYASEDPPSKKEALTRSAWISYALGDLSQASSDIEVALQISAPFPETDYVGAKIFVEMNDMARAKQSLIAAFKQGYLYTLRALNDPSFNNDTDRLLEWIASARTELEDDMKVWRDSELNLPLLRRALDERFAPTTKTLNNFERVLSRLNADPTLLYLHNLKNKAKGIEVDANLLLIDREEEVSAYFYEQKIEARRKAERPRKQSLVTDRKISFGAILIVGIVRGPVWGCVIAFLCAVLDQWLSGTKGFPGDDALDRWFLPGLVSGVVLSYLVFAAMYAYRKQKEAGNERKRVNEQLGLEKKLDKLAKEESDFKILLREKSGLSETKSKDTVEFRAERWAQWRSLYLSESQSE